MLYIKHYKVSKGHQRVQLLAVIGVFVCICDAGGVNAGVNTLCLCRAEKINKEIYLQKRLSARDGNSAVAVKMAVVPIFLDYLIHRHFGAATHLPCIGIMTVQTSHRTALHK